MKINVLGTEYTIERCGYSEKPIFKERGIDWIAIQFPKMQKAFKDADCM